MKTTVISAELLVSHAFEKDDGEVYVFRIPDKNAEIQYDLASQSVYMCIIKDGKTHLINMPCYTWEQLRYYSNIVGINQELELQRPKRLAIIVNRCVYCRAIDRDVWVRMEELTDRDEIIFHTKYDWLNKVIFSFNPLIRNTIVNSGVFVDYDNLMNNF